MSLAIAFHSSDIARTVRDKSMKYADQNEKISLMNILDFAFETDQLARFDLVDKEGLTLGADPDELWWMDPNPMYIHIDMSDPDNGIFYLYIQPEPFVMRRKSYVAPIKSASVDTKAAHG